ncbi:MAG: isoprenyl transferase [bacterium]|nr:isoprenyl transferase [bacterium]
MGTAEFNSKKLIIPNHLAIVMDGNGRWAKKRGLTRLAGHKKGVKAALEVVKYCGQLKIPYLTLYAFSSENWRRPDDEVFGLMKLLYGYLTKEADSLIENGVSLHTIGSLEKLPKIVQKALLAVCEKTKGGKRLHLTLALSYGSRNEIVRAAQKIGSDIKQGLIVANDIDEALISSYLDTRDIPDPDFWIRTGGEMRLSNFLLWQLSYTELYVSPTFWPDFGKSEIDKALTDFNKRERRFGQISEQIVGP